MSVSNNQTSEQLKADNERLVQQNERLMTLVEKHLEDSLDHMKQNQKLFEQLLQPWWKKLF